MKTALNNEKCQRPMTAVLFSPSSSQLLSTQVYSPISAIESKTPAQISQISNPVRPKSSYFMDPQRTINYASKVFTTHMLSIDKQGQDVEDIILKYNKRPRTTDKKTRIEIDLNQKPLQEIREVGSTYYKRQTQDHQAVLSIASTRLTSAGKGFMSDGMMTRIQSGKTTNVLNSPQSRNFPSTRVQSAVLSQQSTGTYQNLKTKPVRTIRSSLKQSQSQKSINTLDYQNFFAKNAESSFGIASCVIKGTKIRAQLKKESKKLSQVSTEQQIQTEIAETLIEEDEGSEIMFEDRPNNDNGKKSKAKNLLFQGAHVKVFAQPKEIVQSTRPMSAATSRVNGVFQKVQSAQVLNPLKKPGDDIIEILEEIAKDEEQSFQMKAKDISKMIKMKDHSKLNSQLKADEILHKSIFREKKRKILELEDFLTLLQHEYQLEKFGENQRQINETLHNLNLNQDDLYNQHKFASVVESMKSSVTVSPFNKDQEDSQIQSTGLRLRRLTAKFGPKIDLISHGFQRFKVQEIEQFFDPMRLKLMVLTLNDIPNPHTKQGSDSYFVRGYKLYFAKDYQGALNSYEDGIQNFPGSSFNCKFNKGVILFKLGLFKEALGLYRQIQRDEPMNKLLCYNKAICEIQNGLFNQCVINIDAYIHEYKERQHKLDLDRQGVEQLSYQEKILFQKPNFILDDKYLFELYQIRGVACLRGNKVVEASKSFTVAQEFKNASDKTPQQPISHQNSSINQGMPPLSSVEVAFTEVSIDQYQSSKQTTDRLLDVRIRPMTAKLPKSSSQQILKPRLETLEEEGVNFNQESHQNQQTPDLSDQVDEPFHLDADSIMRSLDEYDQELKLITKDLDLLKNTGSKNIHLNRNLDVYFQNGGELNTAKVQTRQDNMYFADKNILVNIDKPKGIISQFLSTQQGTMEKKQQKLKDSIKQPEKKEKEISDKTIEDIEWKDKEHNVSPKQEYNDGNQEADEKDILMRPEEFYIDQEKQVRLDKLLLGFEIDPLNDSITDQELKIRQRRQQIADELEKDDSFYRIPEPVKIRKTIDMTDANIDYFLQFLQIDDKDRLLQDSSLRVKAQMDNALDQIKHDMVQFDKHIDDTYNDPMKSQLSVDRNKTVAMQMDQIMRQSGTFDGSATRLLEQTTDESDETFQGKGQIRKRLKVEQMESVIQEFQQPCEERNEPFLDTLIGSLKFFVKFPLEIRTQLFRMGYIEIYEKNQILFNQGDKSEDFFVIIKGSVCIKTIKEEMGYVPVNTKVCYDGDYIGELAHFQVSESLSEETVDRLNRQRVTAIALESPTYLLRLNKLQSFNIINSPSMQSKYQERIKLLRRLDIFEDVDMYILLPLASNIKVRRYKQGEYLVRAGELPEGLFIVTEGQCIVCAEKLALRSTKPTEYGRIHPKNPNVKTNPTGSSHIVYDRQMNKSHNHGVMLSTNDGVNQAEMMRYFSESLGHVNSQHKAYQNEQIMLDDKGKRTKNFTVYKDLMVFFDLMPRSYFGGRVLLPFAQQKQTDDEKTQTHKASAAPRRAAWFAGGANNKGKASHVGIQNIKDFEHIFIKRRYSQTTQKIMKNDRSSMLSVIANSASVEVYLIDHQLLEFFPEHTQKHIWSKLMHVFEPDRPYMLRNVQKIKDKFREWDVYKVKSVQDHLRLNQNLRLEAKQKQVVELDR